MRRAKSCFVLQATGRTTGDFGTVAGVSQCSEGAYREEEKEEEERWEKERGRSRNTCILRGEVKEEQ